MFVESKTRSILKGISWRIFGSLVTAIIVYIFFKRLDLAIVTGITETTSKIFLYFIHERIWTKIKFGKKRIESFNIWLTGLPLSGKTTIADKLYEKLTELQIPIERLDSKDIRELIPDIGYTRKERINHLRRIGHLIKTLQNNSVSVVASFVSPYAEARQEIKQMTNNFIEIYTKASLEECQKRDYKGVYKKALSGEINNLTGLQEQYEEPINPAIILDTEKETIDEMVDKIMKYLQKNYIK